METHGAVPVCGSGAAALALGLWGTCFQLDQRVKSPGGRPRILSRGTVMTRMGVEGLRDQLFAEGQRHGLAQARLGGLGSRRAVGQWNQPVGNTNPASSGQASSGAVPATKP